MRLLTATIPNSQYLIDNTNNSFTLVEATTSDPMGPQMLAVVTLPSGNYSTSQLATALGASLSAVSPQSNTYTATFSTTTSKYTVTSSGLYFFEFQFPSAAGWSLANPANQPSNSINRILGMNPVTSAAGGGPWALIAPNVVDLIRTRNYFINVLPFNSDSKTCRGYAFSFMVPNRFPNNNVAIYDENNNFHQEIFHSNTNLTLSFLDIEVRDEDGQLINFNGVDWSMCVEIITRT